MTSPDSRRRAKQISEQIDEQLKRERAEQLATKGPRILLLGSADSGKTTVLKQMKILHGDGFSQEERMVFRRRILDNILDSMRSLVHALHQFHIPLRDSSNEVGVEFRQHVKDIILTVTPRPI